MATDIAFAVGELSLAGKRVPLSLKVFLLALAIVDDIGAITVIAIFYTDGLALGWLAGAIVLFAVTYGLSRLGTRHVVVYFGIGVMAWLAMHESGVHATIAGLTMGLLVPASARIEDSSLVYRLERILHPWTSYLIVPVFALANAGITLDGDVMHHAASSPVALGVVLGLMLGKPIGITLFAFVAVKLGVAALPDDVRWTQLGAVSMVASIGFTVSLFVTKLAFTDTALVDDAMLGILVGTMLSGVFGLVALLLLDQRSRDAAEASP
jgi:NhaA family Na+:H+ antiporter